LAAAARADLDALISQAASKRTARARSPKGGAAYERNTYLVLRKGPGATLRCLYTVWQRSALEAYYQASVLYDPAVEQGLRGALPAMRDVRPVLSRLRAADRRIITDRAAADTPAVPLRGAGQRRYRLIRMVAASAATVPFSSILFPTHKHSSCFANGSCR
jgi:hypothetical protein